MTEPQDGHWKKGMKMEGVKVRLEKIRDLLIQLRDLEAKEGNKKLGNLERAMAAKDIIAAASK